MVLSNATFTRAPYFVSKWIFEQYMKSMIFRRISNFFPCHAKYLLPVAKNLLKSQTPI